MGLLERIAINEAANERISKIKPGDKITNVCAGKENQRRHAYFVKKVAKTKSICGVPHTEWFIECTDKKGNFWKTDFQVIFSGHLNFEKCKELFEPIWEAHYK